MAIKNFKKELNLKPHYCIEDSIPIQDIMQDGLLVGINNKYAKSFKLQDTIYKLNDRPEQRTMLDRYKEMLNRFDESMEFQFSIFNTRLSKEFMENNVYYKKNGDGYDFLRDAINDNIRKNIVNNTQAFNKEKTLTLSLSAPDTQTAINQMKILEDILYSGIREIEGANLERIKSNEMLQYLNYAYNINKKNTFNTNQRFLRRKVDVFTIENAKRQGITVKELIQPSSMEFRKDYIKMGDAYIRGLYLTNINKQVDTEVVDKICSMNFNIMLTCKMKPMDTDTAVRLVETELSNVEGDIYSSQVKLSQKGGSIDLVPRNLKQRRDEALEANNSLKIYDEKYFEMSIYCLIYAESLKELQENEITFKKIAKGKGLYFVCGNNLQENIFNSCLPYGLNQTPFSRSIDTEGACAFIPFSSQDLMQTNGDYYGKNKLTNNPITYNMMSGDSYNTLILGETGKGKSFSAKLLTTGRRLRNNERDSIYIDPNGEWGGITRELGGEEIKITSGGDNHINLFDIDLEYDKNPLATKEEFIINVCKQMIKSPFGITSLQRLMIAKAMKKIYKEWVKNPIDENIPTIHDFYKELVEIKEKEGKNNEEAIELCNAVEFYAGGGQNTLFQGRTNVNLKNPCICYNIYQLGDDFKPLAMQVIMDNIWVKICKNRNKGRPTDVVIDELHLMFKNEATADWMFKFWKMLRKFLGHPTGISQDAEDILNNANGRAVLNNTTVCMMLSLKESNRQILKQELGLTNEELKFIDNQNPGDGLLYVQKNNSMNTNVVVPFTNPYDKDNIMWQLLHTNGNEKRR